MWRPSTQRRTDVSAYEYNTRYNLQPTEDREAALKKGDSSHSTERPNYKPTALRWYFIVCQVVLLSTMIAMIAYARIRMPDSDSTATIEQRSNLVERALQIEPYNGGGVDSGPGSSSYDPCDAGSNTAAPNLVPRLDEPSLTPFLAPRATETPSGVATSLDSSQRQSLQEQSDSLSSQAEQEKDGKEIDVTVPQVACGTSTICTTSITTSVIVTIIVPGKTETVTVTSGMSTRTTVVQFTTTTVLPGTEYTSSQVTVIEETTDVVVTTTWTVFPTVEPSGTDAAEPQPTTETLTTQTVITKSTTLPILGSSPPRTMTITASSTVSEEVPNVTTSLSVAPDETYFELGPTVIEVTYTPPAQRNAGDSRPEQVPVTHIITTVDPGRTVTDVVRQAPVEVVIDGQDRVETQVVAQAPQTVVQQVGGSVTNVVVVITPSPVSGNKGSAGNLQDADGDGVGGADTNRVNGGADPNGANGGADSNGANGGADSNGANGEAGSNGANGGADSNGANGGAASNGANGEADPDGVDGGADADGVNGGGGFRPVSLTVVSEVGGELQTFTVQDAPQTAVITNADGSVETVVTTPPPRIATSRVGGSLTTFEIVTTPTGSEPISFTVVSTIGGSLTTIITTPSPSKVVTTISGTPTTLTSTPSPSTLISTIEGTTRTVKSVSTPTPTTGPGRPQTELKEYNVNSAKYFVGKFLPTLLAIILAIPLRIIDLNAKIYQPFYAMNAENGALGSESMSLHFNGLNTFTKPFEMAFDGHPIPLITSAILLFSSLMVPLAAEALGLKIHGHCRFDHIQGCALDLGVSPGPTHALMAILALIVVLLLLLLLFTRNRESGLYANPWSIAGIASLSRGLNPGADPARRGVEGDEEGVRYRFDVFRNAEGRDEYGIVMHDAAGRNMNPQAEGEARDAEAHADDSGDELVNYVDGNGVARRRGRRRAGSLEAKTVKARRRGLPFMALGYVWRITFILFLLGLFIVVLYYHISVLRGSTSRFKKFMNSHNFGARFFFAGVGVVITFAWISFFVSIAIITPYQRMAHTPQPPERSILLSRPTHALYGIFASLKDRRGFLVLVSLMSLLSEFLPLLLANVPFNLTQTYDTHLVCARLSLAILGLMILTLVGSLFVRWPDMPIDPRTVEGAMYYVSGSRVLRGRVEGVARMGAAEREKRVMEAGGRYFYGDVDGGGRLGVEADESGPGEGVEGGFGEGRDTAYRGANF
ncbi:uncharacterized protein DNG_07505 [Cephalotrichum gorgonifer]|uniref:Zonadhesin n=1 Tax=Cephalotrichum gorgonifer TaxID=2041049 RepID=A0AAE8N1X5_9PEZI|nr:uncharacterized protein DNG_07505 [Cephalotrichum gorgonifer]